MTFSEKELDRLFEAKIRESEQFKRWFLGKTKFLDRATTIKIARSNHPWYRSKATGKESETDTLLVFQDLVTNEVFAVHVENKRSSGKLTIEQAKTYHERASDWRNRPEYGNYKDYTCVLIAPELLHAKYQDAANIFDSFVSHEAIAEYIPAFTPVFPGPASATPASDPGDPPMWIVE